MGQQISPETARALRMRVSDHEQLIPRVLLRAMAGLVLASLALVSYAVLTDRPLEAPSHNAEPVQSILINIKEANDGGIIVTDMDGAILSSSARDKAGFISVVENALRFERKRHGISENPPVTLIRFANGRLGLRDDATGWKIHLTGFGQDNARAWAAVLAQ